MSEYQCYEFVALDRPLTSKEVAELRAISTRAEITPTRFWNEYQWGDLKADPAKLVERYFDAHLYFANWGTHRLTMRFPSKRVDVSMLRTYFVGGVAHAKVAREHVVLDLHSEDEEPDDDAACQGSLAALVPLRTELMSRDFRFAYIAWLLAVQVGEVPDGDVEPPVPPGLSALTAAQAALIELLRIDKDLFAAAAAPSTPELDDTKVVRAWAFGLSGRAKDQWLARAIENPGLALGAELRRTFRGEKKKSPRPGRTVRELRAAAEEMRDRREQTKSLARERANSPAKAAKNKRLDMLAARVHSAWAELEAMIDKTDYDGAMTLALDLRDQAIRDGSVARFARPFEELRRRQVRRRGFFDRWKRANRAGDGSSP